MTGSPTMTIFRSELLARLDAALKELRGLDDTLAAEYPTNPTVYNVRARRDLKIAQSYLHEVRRQLRASE